MEQENHSEDDETSELETLPQEDDVIPEETALEESHSGSEVHVKAASCPAGVSNKIPWKWIAVTRVTA